MKRISFIFLTLIALSSVHPENVFAQDSGGSAILRFDGYWACLDTGVCVNKNEQRTDAYVVRLSGLTFNDQKKLRKKAMNPSGKMKPMELVLGLGEDPTIHYVKGLIMV